MKPQTCVLVTAFVVSSLVLCRPALGQDTNPLFFEQKVFQNPRHVPMTNFSGIWPHREF